jgi:hypothetical protein
MRNVAQGARQSVAQLARQSVAQLARTAVRTSKPIALRILSDIHLEMNDGEEEWRTYQLQRYLLPRTYTPRHNILCLLGDIGDPTSERYRTFVRRASNTYDQVLLLTGNHEYYNDSSRSDWVRNKSYQEIDQQVHELCDELPNVSYLQNKSLVLHERYHVLGTTFWSHIYDKVAAKKYIHDYRSIYRRGPIIPDSTNDPDERKLQRVTPSDTNHLHAKALAWLQTELAQHPTLPKIVLTHHSPLLPSKDTPTSSPRFYDSFTEAFHSDQSDLIRKHPSIQLWAFGHSHWPTDFMYGTTRIVSNPMGYNHDHDSSNPNLSIELE